MEAVLDKIAIEKYPAYKDSDVDWLGQVPAHWELARLGTRFEEKRIKVSDKEYAPLSVTKQGILPQLDNAAKTNDGDNRKLVRSGDFVINSRSDRKGSSGISNMDGSVSLINIVIEPRNIHPTYCNYLLKSHAFVEEFYRMGHGIVADLWTTRYNEMKLIMIAVPAMEEQTAIANFLDNKTAQIDKAIAQKEKLIELLKERRQILIDEAVMKGLNKNIKTKESKIDFLGKIPSHWNCVKFKYIIRTKARLGWKGLKASEYVDKSNYGFLSTPNIKAEEIDFEKAYFITQKRYEESPEIMLQKNDVLLVKDGSTLGIVNIIHHLPFSCTVNSSIAVLRVNDPNKLYPHFLCYFLRSEYSQKIIELKKGGMGVPHLFQSDINNFIVLLPPIEEQREIVLHVELEIKKINKGMVTLEKEIEKLKEYKTTLINAAVTGKIKVC